MICHDRVDSQEEVPDSPLLPIPLWGTRVACLFLGSVKLGGDKKRVQMLTNSVLQIAYNSGGGGVVNLACCRYCWSRGL